MGGKPKAPPPPDYSGIARASEESARYSYEIAREQLAWAKQQYAQDREITDSVISDAMKRADLTDQQAARDRARYEQTFQPLEDALASEVREFGYEGTHEAAAARASTDVSKQFALARSAAQDRLESFGIDPSQTRAAALDMSTRTAEAAARAQAANMGREQSKAVGRALRSEAINVGRGYPGQVANSYQTALASGNQAVQAGNTTTATGGQTMGTGAQWQGMGNSALGTWGNTLNMGYQNQMDAYKAKQSASSGWGQALGMIGGIGMKFATAGMFEEGGAVPEADEMVPHEGIPIHDSMSPSGGDETDDVAARLNAGEFVIPEDVVKWEGEKGMQRLIEKARREKQEAAAKPKIGAVPIEAPVVDTTTAIPVR